jgi:predicted lipoprotein with Yx(FWY)xxD motif
MHRFAVRAAVSAAAAALASSLLSCSNDQGSTAAPVPTSSQPAPTTTAPSTAAPTTTVAPSTAPATTPPAPPAPKGTALKVGLPGFRTALADAGGRAVYAFSPDNRGASRCVGACATPWPPVLTTGAPTVTGAGANARQLGSRRRADGKLQVTYAGWPLYYFFRDSAPGTTTGQGRNVFGGTFRLIMANGAMVTG